MAHYRSLFVGKTDILRQAEARVGRFISLRLPILGMAWTLLREGDYLLRLTDGFITERKRRSPSWDRHSSTELAIAERLLAQANKRYAGDLEGAMRFPDPLDVWVIGAAGWLARQSSEPLESICEGESTDNYRIIIAGEGLNEIAQPRVVAWQRWTREAGMKRKKRHVDHHRFRYAGETLLGMMHDYRDQTGQPPTSILQLLNVPVAYAGASGQSRDIAPSRRIQQ